MDLVLHVDGKVTKTNFKEYKEEILARIDSINLKPEGDDELAEAKKTIKVLAGAEKDIDKAREKALDDTAEIRDLFVSMTEVADRLRETRLALDKVVKKAENDRKKSILNAGVKVVEQHIKGILAEQEYIPIGFFHVCEGDFLPAVKGKRKIDTYQKAVDDTANALCEKITQMAALCKVNAELILAVEPPSLFPDMSNFLCQPTEAVESVIKARISEYRIEQKILAEREQNKKAAEEQAAYATANMLEDEVNGTQPMPGAEVDVDKMVDDRLPEPQQEPCSVDQTQAGRFLLTVALDGDVATVKAIAVEVDGIISKHKEVVSISLRKV